MGRQTDSSLIERQMRLARALRSFPEKISEESLEWRDGYELYEALRKLPPDILCSPGRFLYSDVFTLRQGRYYLLGYNPATGFRDYPVCLRNEIRCWFAKINNAYLNEFWRNNQPGHSSLQKNVKALLDNVATDVRSVCASNLYFTRSAGAKQLKLYNDFSVHKAVINIVEPDCIIAFGNGDEGTGADSYSQIIKDLKLEQIKEKEPFLIKRQKNSRNNSSFDGYMRIVEGKLPDRDKPLIVIGLPHLSHFNLGKDALKRITEAWPRWEGNNASHPQSQ